MSIWLTKDELERVKYAGEKYSATPIPPQMVSNGEYSPLPQTKKQKAVEEQILSLSDKISRKKGVERRSFLKTGCGMALAFMSMNQIYGRHFEVSEEETIDDEAVQAWVDKLSNQFIFDDQLHYVTEDYSFRGILGLREVAAQLWNPDVRGQYDDFKWIQFENFVKEVYFDSDTTIGLLSGAPSDNVENWFLSNQELADARKRVNELSGTKRLYAHAVITPGQDGWMDVIDHAIDVLKPDSWKGYTIGDPLSLSEHPWRLDDEKLMYPAYEKMEKAGIRNVCIHKGLLPANYETVYPGIWQYAGVDDVGKAAKDFPGLNFIIYHAGLKIAPSMPEESMTELNKTGRMDWVSELAEIPEKYGVTNVYGEVGSSFGSACINHPRHAAALLAIMIKGMGADHVIWGTDSVWYGSPQWQIEALRRIEVPLDLQEKFGFAPLGLADGEVKTAIFSGNASKLYNLSEELTKVGYYAHDEMSKVKKAYQNAGGERSNMVYGFLHK